MKIFLLVNILAFTVFANAVDTLNGCTNPACQYCQDLAASCQDGATGSQSGTDCLCTERFKVNLSRCLSGVTCAWDGTGSSAPPICPDVYCPGTFDQSFINECPGVSITGPPYPLPTPAPGQTSTSGTRTTSGGSSIQSITSGPNSGNSTTTGTVTSSSSTTSTSSSTPNTGYAPTVSIPFVLAILAALGTITHWK